MGEIAEGLINGDCDYFTGEYIGPGYGIPRTSDRSFPWEKKYFTQSKEMAFKGVKKYLHNKLGITDITNIINRYLPDNGKSLKQKCLSIQKEFGAFVKWINNNKYY